MKLYIYPVKHILTIAIIFLSITGYSQVKDTVNVHSPKKAAIKSLILPGLGQAYNKKYWKIPVIYGAVAGLYFWSDFSNTNLKNATTAFCDLNDSGGDYTKITINEYRLQGITTSQIQQKVNEYRRDRDFAYILMGLTYILNIVDANVDAHLLNYNVSDDLSLQLKPSTQNSLNGLSSGFTLSLKLK